MKLFSHCLIFTFTPWSCRLVFILVLSLHTIHLRPSTSIVHGISSKLWTGVLCYSARLGRSYAILTEDCIAGVQTDAERAATNAIHWLQSCNAYVILDSGGVYAACCGVICCIPAVITPFCALYSTEHAQDWCYCVALQLCTTGIALVLLCVLCWVLLVCLYRCSAIICIAGLQVKHRLENA